MLQLKKSVHLDSFGQPFKQAIVTAARIGADAVEINGTQEIRANNMSRTAIRHVRKLLSDLNLQVAAIHFPTRMGYGDMEQLDQRIDGTKATMRLAYELGCNVVTNRLGKIPTETDDPAWTTMLQALTDIGNHSQNTGAWLAVRTGAEPGSLLKGLIDSLPIHSLGVDFDPAELIINGHSPNEAMQALRAHVMHVRARDAVTDLAIGRGVETPLGQGSVDWAMLLASLEEQSYQGHFTVQSDRSPNSASRCASSIRFLEELFH